MPSMCIMYYNRINFPLPSLSPLPLLMAHFFLLTLPAPETFMCAVIVQVDTDAVCMQSQSLWYSHKTLFYSTSPHPASLTSFLPSHPWCSLSFRAGSIDVPLKGEHSHTHKSFFFLSTSTSLWVVENHYPLKKETSLAKSEANTNIAAWYNI